MKIRIFKMLSLIVITILLIKDYYKMVDTSLIIRKNKKTTYI
jgi:hypothetical protein